MLPKFPLERVGKSRKDEDKTGNLNDLLLTLKDSNVSVDYLYLSFNRDSGKPIMVFHTEDTMEVRVCLKSRGYTVL